jgi:hypothetical protein
MKKKVMLMLICVIGLACKKEVLRPSGNVVEEKRSLNDFNKVVTRSSNSLIIKHGDKFQVILKGSDNLLPHFETKLVGKELHLGYDRSVVRRDDVDVIVILPVLNAVTAFGSGNVDIAGGFINLTSLKIFSSGSSRINASESFHVEELQVDISGSGLLSLEKVSSRNATINLSGSGRLNVHAQNTLKVNISGSGKIFYLGNPAVESSISGSGKVERL